MTVVCELCPKGCRIGPGQSGDCRIRVNIEGKLTAVAYGFPSAVHVDPIEKKPMYHFLPGSSIFSIATVGCNLHCKNCQNWDLSQRNPEDAGAVSLPPEKVPLAARRSRSLSVAYTYSDPMAFYEYTLDSCITSRKEGLNNVLVTAGYINEKPLRELARYVDGANVDLKAFSDRFYREICEATLKPVLNTLVTLRSMDVIVEVTNLLIPTLNDSDRDITALCAWIAKEMGKDTPLHFSRFFPHYRMKNLPATPSSTLSRAKQIADAEGLLHVYAGNILLEDSGNTYCPSCRKLLVGRRGYVTLENHMVDGACPVCKTKVYGRWN